MPYSHSAKQTRAETGRAALATTSLSFSYRRRECSRPASPYKARAPHPSTHSKLWTDATEHRVRTMNGGALQGSCRRRETRQALHCARQTHRDTSRTRRTPS
ncbi:unnamed protein product [Chondrus crispus]|uniref:Uncharacterized protein n=1 Tax=Chondrus crispus TaxID=2769 RepID=R7QH26_CHOCR|nr:unnamed protein product [Chondrus crispus]CDF36725.1 unnamed protein product [Chondrus crispus]|eukprot:XP_005716544.1 unnamed protein product [Chondrus crispus]